MRDGLGDGEDRADRHAGLGEQVSPLLGRLRRQRQLDDGQQLLAVTDPSGIGGIPVVADQVVQPDGVHEPPPQPVVSHGDHEVAVTAGNPW